MAKYDIFLISPVRNITEEQKSRIAEFVDGLEKRGMRVYWPLRDTNQEDKLGLRICTDNRSAMQNSGMVDVWYSDESISSIFDLGMAFSLGKAIRVANPQDIKPTQAKSFANVLLELHRKESY